MKNGQWEIVVCGGKELKQVYSLVKAGVPPSDSELLVSDLSKAELKLPASLQKRFDSFSFENQEHHSGREKFVSNCAYRSQSHEVTAEF